MNMLLNKRFTLVILSAIFVTLPAMADYNGKKRSASKQTSMQKERKLTESMLGMHATIDFAPGSSVLSEAHRAALRSLIRENQSKGEIADVTIASWSDKALPPKGQKLLEMDSDLAENRADAIATFLKTELEVEEIDTYNMAESSNWLARTFGTKEAELKSLFAKKGEDTPPVTNEEFNIIKRTGGASMAVVVVEMK